MKLLLMGAGIRTPLMIHGLLRREKELELSEVVLFDTDAGRLAVMHWLATEIVQRNGGTFNVDSSTSLEEAAEGAAFIFSAIRVGQEESRVADEKIAIEAGVLGQETTGAGGFSMALRTIPVLLDYAKTIERVAPDAWFVNFTNPAGLITQALRNETTLKVIGICDTPTAMRISIASYLNQPIDDVLVDYVGLNHLGWVRDVTVGGESCFNDILADYEGLQQAGHEWTLFDPALVRSLNLLPNEYLYYFYARERAVENIRVSGSTRGMQIQAINEPLWAALKEYHADGNVDAAIETYANAMLSRSGSYMARESGHVVETDGRSGAEAALALFKDEGYAGLAMDVMQAVIRNRKAVLILNVRNDGCVAELQDDDVIEAPCLVDAQGIRPLAQTELPESIRGLVQAVKTYERYAVHAAVEGDRDAAMMALTVHPLVCSWSLAEQLVDAYLSAHRDLLPQFS